MLLNMWGAELKQLLSPSSGLESNTTSSGCSKDYNTYYYLSFS
jgi:hypothetical protein